MTRFCLRLLADQFGIGKAATSQSRSRFHKPISIGSFAGIESESLFVQVSEKMEWLNTNVGALNHSFQKRPKVFN